MNFLAMRRFTFLASLLLRTLASPPAAGQVTTTVVSQAPDGTIGNNWSWASKINPDGRYVLFNSGCSNLVTQDTNGNQQDVFVWDRIAGIMRLASLSSNNTQILHGVGGRRITPDGRFVSMYTGGKLVPEDTNLNGDVYIRDLRLGTTILASKTSAGTQVDQDCGLEDISDDGRFLVFASDANNLGGRDFDYDKDVYWRDLELGLTRRVSRSSTGVIGNYESSWPRISADGRMVFFESFATNLVHGDTNQALDVFSHSIATGATSRLSLCSNGTQPLGGGSGSVVVSKSGRYIAFGSSATNLHPNDTNGWVDIFLRDLVTGQVTLVSQTPAGFSGNGLSYNPDLSDDGRYVVFHSAATDLVANDTNATWDVFRFDQMTGTLLLVTQSSSGVQGNSYSNWSYAPSVSADGRYVTYSSYSDNLVPNDTNGGTDIFLTELPPGP